MSGGISLQALGIMISGTLSMRGFKYHQAIAGVQLLLPLVVLIRTAEKVA